MRYWKILLGGYTPGYKIIKIDNGMFNVITWSLKNKRYQLYYWEII